jgi:hypothetical protein
MITRFTELKNDTRRAVPVSTDAHTQAFLRGKSFQNRVRSGGLLWTCPLMGNYSEESGERDLRQNLSMHPPSLNLEQAILQQCCTSRDWRSLAGLIFLPERFDQPRKHSSSCHMNIIFGKFVKKSKIKSGRTESLPHYSDSLQCRFELVCGQRLCGLVEKGKNPPLTRKCMLKNQLNLKIKKIEN